MGFGSSLYDENDLETIDEDPVEDKGDEEKDLPFRVLARYTTMVGLIVDTSQVDGIFRTHVVTSKFNNGEKTIVECYDSYACAMTGHHYWKNRFVEEQYPTVDELVKRKNKLSVSTDPVSISFKSLIVILTRMIGKDTNLLITNIPESENLRLQINNSKWLGSCKYDTKERKAFDISDCWYYIIQQAKSEIQENSQFFDNRRAFQI